MSSLFNAGEFFYLGSFTTKNHITLFIYTPTHPPSFLQLLHEIHALVASVVHTLPAHPHPLY